MVPAGYGRTVGANAARWGGQHVHVDERGSLDLSLGISRRTLLRRGAIVGGSLLWTTPVVQTLASPGLATGSQIIDISYLAVLIRCGGRSYRMKWETSGDGRLLSEAGPSFVVPADNPLLPPSGSVADGAAPGTSAIRNADGSISLELGSGCTLIDFVVKHGQCVAGPGVAGQPAAGQTGGTIRFSGQAPNGAPCAATRTSLTG
jgi:hypothetical protein